MFKQLNEAALKPELWSAYTAEKLWTDSHTSKQMLSYHLNPNINVASRTKDFIDQSVNWLVSEFALNQSSKIIDFGCGPGLYTQRLKTHKVGTVVGLDFSKNSLEYASQQAKSLNLNIEYHYGNYLNFTDPRKFDLISLVMCDLCALNPTQRATLLGKFKSLLKPNGVIALDVYTKTRFEKQSDMLILAKNSMNGFWSTQDYWCIQSSFLYESELVTLDKYVIYEKQTHWTVYNWLQHFTLDMLKNELELQGLAIQATYSDLCGGAFVDGDEIAVIIGHKYS